MNNACSRAQVTDPSLSKETYFFVKNGLIPYEPEKQFPNAYKEWKDTFDNVEAYGCIQNEWTYKGIYDLHDNDGGKNYGKALGRNDNPALPGGELYICDYNELKKVFEKTDDPDIITDELGFDDGYFYDNPGYLFKIDKSLSNDYTYSQASDSGVNYYWAPGLRTSGGNYEAVIDRVEQIDQKEDAGLVVVDKKKLQNSKK